MSTPRLQNKFTIVQNAILVPVIEISLKLFGIRRTWSAMAFCMTKRAPSALANQEVMKSLSELKRAMALCPFKGKCLARSLVLWWQLERRGISSTLHIGVKNQKMMRAHAWLEYEGRILNAGPQVHSRYWQMAKFCSPADLG